MLLCRVKAIVVQRVCIRENQYCSFSFLYGHLLVGCHFLSKGFLAMLPDIMDAGRPIAVEQECKDFADEVVVNLTLLHLFVALGTGVEALFLTALPNLAPLKPLVKGLA